MAIWLVENWGNLASALGLLVSVVGFSIAVYQTMRSRKAAEAAEKAVIETQNTLAKNDTIADLTAASERIQDLRRIFRQGSVDSDRAFDIVSNIRRTLSDISVQHPNLSEDDRRNLHEAADVLGRVEWRTFNRGYGDEDEHTLLGIESVIHKLASGIKQSL